MPRGAPSSEKIDILNKILEKKEVLLGDFDLDKGITREAKADEWKKIFVYAQAQGYSFTGSKEWTYLRDNWWPNQKSATLVRSCAFKKLKQAAENF